MGKGGTGWSRTISSQIRKQLDTVISPNSKLTRLVKKLGPHSRKWLIALLPPAGGC